MAQGSLSDSQRQTFPTDTFLAGLEAVFKRAMEPVAEKLDLLHGQLSASPQDVLRDSQAEPLDEVSCEGAVQQLLDDCGDADSNAPADATPGSEEDDLLSEYREWLKEEEDGPALSAEMAKLADKLACVGIDDKELLDRTKKYKKPANSTALTRVRVNPMIWDILGPKAKVADAAFQKLQSPLAAGLTAVARLADQLKDTKQRELLAIAMDALAILGRVDRDLNLKRREFLRPGLSDNFKHLFTKTQAITDQLFGDDLAENIKTISDGLQVTKKLQPSTSKWRGTAPRFRPRGVARGTPPYPGRGHFQQRPFFRGGGQGRGQRMSYRPPFPQRGRGRKQ